MIGGGAMISITELVGLLILLAILAQWRRAEQTATAALDRHLDAALERVPAVASPADEAADATAERVRPWWETDTGAVGQRYRATRRDQDRSSRPR